MSESKSCSFLLIYLFQRFFYTGVYFACTAVWGVEWWGTHIYPKSADRPTACTYNVPLNLGICSYEPVSESKICIIVAPNHQLVVITPQLHLKHSFHPTFE